MKNQQGVALATEATAGIGAAISVAVIGASVVRAINSSSCEMAIPASEDLAMATTKSERSITADLVEEAQIVEIDVRKKPHVQQAGLIHRDQLIEATAGRRRHRRARKVCAPQFLVIN